MTQLVSVVITTYNGAHFLEYFSIPSVVAQSYQNWELIIVDDGSIDNTEEVVKKFPSIRYFKHQKNRGLAAAMNTGIRESRGEYIAFLEHDDVWLPYKLEEQMKALSQNPDYISCHVYAWKLDLKKKSIVDVYPAGFSSPVWYKSVFLKIGLFEENKEILGIEDGDLAAKLEIAKANKKLDLNESFLLKQPLLIYTKHNESLSDHYSQFLKIGKRYEAMCQRYNQAQLRKIPGIKKLLSFWYLHLGYNLLLRGKYKKGLHCLLTSLPLDFTFRALFLISIFWMPKRIHQTMYKVYSNLLEFRGKAKVLKWRKNFPNEYQQCFRILKEL